MEPKLKRVMRIDSIPAADASIDEQGFLHDTPVVTSTGIFEYSLPDGKVRRELRLPEHVFDKKSLASYSGKPVIITHEAGSIDKNNVMNEIVGTILTEGYQDGSDVRCKIVIHDIDKVKKIPFRELSLGYNLDLVEEPGEWNGEPYDAIQTNIRINHLAIVEKARAGDQAHLNLDGKSKEVDDRKKNEGGKDEMLNTEMHSDSIDMTPEELIEAIKCYKASKTGNPEDGNVAQPEVTDGGAESGSEATDVPTDPSEGSELVPPAPETEKHDDCVGKLIVAVKELLAALEGKGEQKEEPATMSGADGAGEPGDCQEGNDDSSDDKSQSMNNDSADDFQQRLSICRIGDKLHMDGLESKSIMEAKKAIVKKVLPTMNLDGKSNAYVDAAYDMAVCEANKRKDVAYQKKQMTATPAKRTDGQDNVSMAASARQKMIEREGGKE